MEENRMPCTVVQDLMPLVCDGAGSKESEEMVSAHIASGAECRKVWELLHRRDSSLSPSADDSAEKQGFRKSMEKQRRKFNIWRAAAILCALVVLCADVDGSAMMQRYGCASYLVSGDPGVLLDPLKACLTLAVQE